MNRQDMFPQPNTTQIEEEVRDRDSRHEHAEAPARGRKPRAERQRTKGLGLKVTDEKMEQLIRLSKLTRWNQTDIVEVALDTFEAAWKAGKIK
jgi:hypothetical protein